MNSSKVLEVILAISAKIDEEKQFLTQLDNVIGDGDHGINMARGFKAFETKIPAVEGKDIGTILKTVGMTLVSTVGGSAGPLYGTAFMKAGMANAGKEEIDLAGFVETLGVAIEGVKMRGKATKGEKTMLDAMIPAYDAMKAAVESGMDAKTTLDIGVGAALEGVEYTKTIIATKGRASYVGERSIGHQDPGATSFTNMLEVIAASV
ncbi:MAG: dihydroxyacetone kinase subunit L [Lachnospiraceae bacterium]|nr:dihydroxyacetone kinase subunit L [Lachnospiraceae bacterium]